MIDLKTMFCLFGDIVVFEVDCWEVRRRVGFTSFGAGYWFGFSCVLFRCIRFFLATTGFCLIEFKVTPAPRFSLFRKKVLDQFEPLHPFLVCPVVVGHTFICFSCYQIWNRRFPALVISVRLSISRRVGLFSRLFIISISFLFAPQWW